MPAHTPEQTQELLAAAFNAGDLDAFVEVYEENAKLVVPPDASSASGREEIRRALEPTFALEPRAKLEVAGKLQSDGLALTHARWTLVGTDAEGQSVHLKGKRTIVCRQQRDGRWLIVLDKPLSPR